MEAIGQAVLKPTSDSYGQKIFRIRVWRSFDRPRLQEEGFNLVSPSRRRSSCDRFTKIELWDAVLCESVLRASRYGDRGNANSEGA
jgi:hypothetical protein